MTKKNETMHLINQAQNEARKCQITNFLCKNRKILLALLTTIIIASAGFFAFKLYQKTQQEKFSKILHQSLIDQQSGDLAKAKENLKKIYDAKSAPSNIRALAALRYAAFLLEEGKNSESAKIYQEISNCSYCDSYLKDLSGLLLVKTWMLDDAEIQKEDLPDRIEKIENASKTLKYQIAEQRAFLEMQKNNLAKSYQIFDSITKNPEVSNSLKSRSNDGLKMVKAKGYEPEESKPEAQTEKTEPESKPLAN